ncbi:MAG: hypothetical protein WD206_05915 [Actinomycetota bacterium]
MRPAGGALVGPLIGLASFGFWVLLQRTRARDLLARDNYRGARLSLTLGLAMGTGVVVAIGVVAGWIVVDGGWRTGGVPMLVGASIVLLAGFVDDIVPGRARGLRGHLAELGHGHVGTGLLKAVAAVLAAMLAVADAGGSGWERLAGVVLVAGCANLWNLLDVRPGRAVKAYLLAAVALVVADPGAVLLAASGPVLVLAWFDVRERGMIGDTGANVIGYVIGVEAYLRLPGPGVVVAAAVVVALTIVAETVTLSRVIDGVAPLRRLDRVGRIRVPGPDSRANGDGVS